MSRETTIYEDLAAILLQFTKDVKEGSIATVPVEGEDLKVTNVIDASPQAIAFLPAEHMKLQVFFLFLLLAAHSWNWSSKTDLIFELKKIKRLTGGILRTISHVDLDVWRRQRLCCEAFWRSCSWLLPHGLKRESKAQPYKFDFRSMRTSQTSNRRDPYYHIKGNKQYKCMVVW